MREENVFALFFRSLSLLKTNIIEKGIGQLLLEPTLKIALKRYFGEVRFDLIHYSMIDNEFKYHHSIDCRNSAEEVFDKNKDWESCISLYEINRLRV